MHDAKTSVYATLRAVIEDVVHDLSAALRDLPNLDGNYTPLSRALLAALTYLRDTTLEEPLVGDYCDVLLAGDEALCDALARGWRGRYGDGWHPVMTDAERDYLREMKAYLTGESVSEAFTAERRRRRSRLTLFGVELTESEAVR